MSSRGDFGYGSTREYTDNPVGGSTEYRDNPFADSNRGYQGRVALDPVLAFGNRYNDFNQISDTISNNIFKISNSATTLERAIKQLGTKTDSVQLRDRIHDTEITTNGVINETIQCFRQLTQCSSADRNQKLQFQRLKGELQENVQRYNTLQKKVAEKVKATKGLSSQSQSTEIKTQKLVDWGDTDDDDQSRLIEEQEQRREQMMAEEEIIDTDLALIQEREERIRQLESDVLDINEIFRDLGTLVSEQGEMINNIEDNVENAYQDVEAGNEQLNKASRYQRKARKKMCILVLILVVIAAIIAIILATSLKK